MSAGEEDDLPVRCGVAVVVAVVGEDGGVVARFEGWGRLPRGRWVGDCYGFHGEEDEIHLRHWDNLPRVGDRRVDLLGTAGSSVPPVNEWLFVVPLFLLFFFPLFKTRLSIIW